MSQSTDTFKVYVESLDSSRPPSTEGQKGVTPENEPEFDAFDTSFVDKVIFQSNQSSNQLNANPDCNFSKPGFLSQTSLLSDDIIPIDSGLNSPENALNYKKPAIFKFNSFMIWDDPNQENSQESQTGTSELSKSVSDLQHLSKKVENLSYSLNSTNMKTIKKRGLFSRSSGTNASGSELDVSLAADKFSKPPNSPNGKTGQNNRSNDTTGGNGVEEKFKEEEFNGEGVQFQGKLIGHEYVAEARGEQMCQASLKKLKIIQKAVGGHKRRIHLYISFDGIKINDAVTLEQLFHHTVPQISFISRDESDTRAFGYVFGNSSTGHQFIGIKTKKEAMLVMQCIGQLFGFTLKRKQRAEEAVALAETSAKLTGPSSSELEPALVSDASADEPMYHSVCETDPQAGTLSRSNLNRPRRSRTTSSSSENATIPALPPPSSDHRRGQPQQHQQSPIYKQQMFAATNTHSQAPNSSTNLFDEGTKLSSPGYNWAHFDDDNNHSASANISNSLDDSTLNAVSSLSDMNMPQSFSTSQTLSQNDQTSASATLVARYNQKQNAKNSSSSTIASTNFDGADPFSDAFGSDDPFSGSLAINGGMNDKASFAIPTLKNESSSNSVPSLTNQLASISIDNSASSFKSNLELSNRSVDSASSADKYAALADINNLSNSIFDKLNSTNETKNIEAQKNISNSLATTSILAAQPFDTNNAVNFNSSAPAQSLGQQQIPIYHSAPIAIFPYASGNSAAPQMMPPTASQMYPVASIPVTTSSVMRPQRTLVHSAEWSAASTSSLPNSFADQSHFLSGGSPAMNFPYNPAINHLNGMFAHDNPIKVSSNSLHNTPHQPVAPFQSASNLPTIDPPINSINRTSETPFFQDLDPLSNAKQQAPFLDQQDKQRNHAFVSKHQQQSFDSFTRNCSPPNSGNANRSQSFSRRSPATLSSQNSFPNSSLGNSSLEPSLPPPSSSSPLSIYSIAGTSNFSFSGGSSTNVSPSQMTTKNKTFRASSAEQTITPNRVSNQPTAANLRSDEENFGENESVKKLNILPQNKTNQAVEKNVSSQSFVNIETTSRTSSNLETTTSVSNRPLSDLRNKYKTFDPKFEAPGENAFLASKQLISEDNEKQSPDVKVQFKEEVKSVEGEKDDDEKEEEDYEEEEEEEEEKEENDEKAKEEEEEEENLLSFEECDKVISDKLANKPQPDTSFHHLSSSKAEKSTTDDDVLLRCKLSGNNDELTLTKSKAALSRQSSSASSTRDRIVTPPAIPPRTDLLHQGQKYRCAVPTPPPLPPPNKGVNSGFMHQFAPPSYMHSYSSYGSFAPSPEMYATSEAKQYNTPPPPPPLPPPRLPPPMWHASPLWNPYMPPDPSYYRRAMESGHAFPLASPYQHSPYDPYYRHPLALYQSTSYTHSPGPLPQPPDGYHNSGWIPDYYQQPPPPIPCAPHYQQPIAFKKTTSSISSTPPPLDSCTPPPSNLAPPLPNPQRRISASSSAERSYGAGAPQDVYFSSLSRSSSAVSGASDQAQSSVSSVNKSIPSYPPPPPPDSAIHGSPTFFPTTATAHYYQADTYEHLIAPHSSGDATYEHFYDIPRRKDSDYTIPNNKPVVPSGFVSFNANMEQMMMKYHRPSGSPIADALQDTTPMHLKPCGATYYSAQQTPPKRFPYQLPHADATGSGNGCYSSGSSSGSSGYSTTTPNFNSATQQRRQFFASENCPPPTDTPLQQTPMLLQPTTTQMQQNANDAAKPPSNVSSSENSNSPAALANLFDDNFADNTSTLMPYKNKIWFPKEFPLSDNNRDTSAKIIDHQANEDDNRKIENENNGEIDRNNNDSVFVADVTKPIDVQTESDNPENLSKESRKEIFKKIALIDSDNASMEERNIFSEKVDPFDDDFFKK